MSFGGSGKGPFDFDASRMPSINIPKFAPKNVIGILAALFAAVALFSSVYQIQPDENGVVLRFGRFTDTTNPGLHFLIPFVEQVIKVPVERQLKQEFGFRTADAGVRTQYVNADFTDESAMLTGDLNVAVVEWIVQYKIKNPEEFLFNVRNPESTFRQMSEAAMRKVVGDHSVDEVITTGRASIAAQAKVILQTLGDTYGIGIDVQQVVLQDVNPPDPVKPSFNEVNEAIQEKEQLINLARTDYNQAIPKARGEAEQVIQEAVGYAAARINRAQGEATRFESIYAEYRKAPRVTRSRMYLEMLNEVLPRVGKKVIIDEDAAGVLPFLNLTGEGNK
ncbi:MAG: FtsH protease activity modulator HflK [Acidobacteriota bacterium]|nr:MAG: FtsH protease activity modulator HflK [Acidobacteriota bacterium]